MNGSVVRCKGRAPVATPQGAVVVTTIIPKGEKDRRANEVRGDGPTSVYSPAVGGKVDTSARQGMLIMHRAKFGATFRQAVTADSYIEGVTCTNGLSRDVKLMLPGVVRTDSNAADEFSNNQSTVNLHGVETIDHRGTMRIQAGDVLYIDLNTPMVQQKGELVPAVQGPEGVADTFAGLSARPMPPVNMATFICDGQDRVRTLMGTAEFQEEAQKASTADAVRVLVMRECDKLFTTSFIVSADHPIRGYLPVWLIERMRKQSLINRYDAMVKREDDKAKRAARASLLYTAAAVLIMRQCASDYADLVDHYAESLPHDTDAQSNSEKRNAHSRLVSHHLDDLTAMARKVDASTHAQEDPVVFSARLLAAGAHVDMHVLRELEIYVHRVRAHFARFALGVALSSCERGGAYDAFVGKPI